MDGPALPTIRRQRGNRNFCAFGQSQHQLGRSGCTKVSASSGFGAARNLRLLAVAPGHSRGHVPTFAVGMISNLWLCQHLVADRGWLFRTL